MLQEMRRDGARRGPAVHPRQDALAMWLIKSLDQRQRTIYKVADSIVRQQRAFLDHGIERLRPMVLRDVAEDIGCTSRRSAAWCPTSTSTRRAACSR
jgi:DNA-directed RNA polymerase specialized sigma54-like protein